ncbi:hypothetical protein C8R44DRAFT_938024 [Mycena epipterygia]|nr:hypothetical protein C8R44DRAFT_938024 [Mycena epipterygia]
MGKSVKWVLLFLTVSFSSCCALLGVLPRQNQSQRPPELLEKKLDDSVIVDRIMDAPLSSSPTRGGRYSKRKVSPNPFVDDKAEVSDDGVLVDKEDLEPVREGSPSGLQAGDDEKYESDFINDGDPEDGKSERSEFITPPPPVSRTKEPATPSSPNKSSQRPKPRPLFKSPSKIIDIGTTSEEDLEVMDADDRIYRLLTSNISMFKHASGVMPTALLPSLSTRSSTAKRGSAVSHSREDESPKRRKVADAPGSVVGSPSQPDSSPSKLPFSMDEDTAKAMAEWYSTYMQGKTAAGNRTSENKPLESSPIKRIDFDQIELAKGLKASKSMASALKSKGKARRRSPSPDWDPPYDDSDDKTKTESVVEKNSSGPSYASIMAKLNDSSPSGPPHANLVPAKSDLPVSSYMKPKDVKASVAELARGFAVAAASRRDDDEGQMVDDDQNTVDVLSASRLEATTAFMEDLESYKAYYDELAPCGVADLDLQDEALRPHYSGLPPLPCGRQLLPVYDPDRLSGVQFDSEVKGGRVKFSAWFGGHMKNMIPENAISAMLFTHADRCYINPSRVSPLLLSRQLAAGSSATQRLMLDKRVAVSVPVKLGPKSERMRKWLSGVFHNQDWEHFEALMCLVFGEELMYAQLSKKKVIAFQTMISPADASGGGSSKAMEDRVDRAAPPDMFAPVASTTPAKRGRSPAKPWTFASKTLLSHTDPIPIYDARKVTLDFDADLGRLEKVLPKFNGTEVPVGSFVVVGYTCSSYNATLNVAAPEHTGTYYELVRGETDWPRIHTEYTIAGVYSRRLVRRLIWFWSLFIWPLDGNFSALTVLVIQNIIRPFYPTLDEFAAIFASAPRLEKCCLRNIGCVGITADVAATFTLPYVSELDVGFAVGDATLPALLRSMDLPALKTLRFTGQGDDEVRYMAAATNVLQVIRTLILDVDDFEDAVLADLFIAAGSVTKIDVLTADADVFDALQEADRMMSAEKNCSAHACPDLSALAVSNADPQCVRSFLEARPDTLERMDSVMFRQGLPLDDYDEDLEWMRTHIAVGAYASYNESYWVDHDIKWS